MPSQVPFSSRDATARDAALDLCAFLDASPSPYHAAREAAARLEARGFSRLDERSAWALSPGDRRYLVRGGGTLVAFVMGRRPPAEAGFRVVGAHTDSPNLRVKPNPDVSRAGYEQVGVEVYGGALLHTWLDRDLSLAGEVSVHEGGGVDVRLVDFARPLARIPNLAIHLNRGVNTDGLVVHQQKHLPPVLGLGKEPSLRALLGVELGVEPGRILGFDLCFYDAQRATLAGAREELLLSGRLDNLASCHAAVHSLLEAAEPTPEATLAIALYDHEECGSRSAVGAQGSVLRDVLARLVESTGDAGAEGLVRAMQGSFLVSADMAHAVHPHHDDKHDDKHAPRLGEGLVVKINANQSYATNGRTQARFELACREADVPVQRFVVRSDLPCGSTIGPIASAALGLATVDVGAPMLSMHSCRELTGRDDVLRAIRAYRAALLSA